MTEQLPLPLLSGPDAKLRHLVHIAETLAPEGQIPTESVAHTIYNLARNDWHILLKSLSGTAATGPSVEALRLRLFEGVLPRLGADTRPPRGQHTPQSPVTYERLSRLYPDAAVDNPSPSR